MHTQGFSCAAALGLVIACSSPAELREPSDLTPETPFALLITPTKATWTWDEVSGPQGSGVRATIRNNSMLALTTSLGDRFNSATEHANLYLGAVGGGGAVEWRDATGSWQTAGLAHLVEGVKSVTLRPGGNYTLTALLREPRRSGLFRIRVDFFTSPNGTERHSDFSPLFEIR
jgi:hypothetical protein